MIRHFVLYKDHNGALLEGDAWEAQAFETPEEAQDFVEDLDSSTSAWKDDAVTHVVIAVEVPNALYMEVEDR